METTTGTPARPRGFVRHLFRAHAGRTVAAVALLTLAGAAEAIGVGTLLPVLEAALGSGRSRAGAAILRFVAAPGIPPEPGPLIALVVVAIAAKAVFRWFALRQVGYVVADIGAGLRRRMLRALASARWEHFTEMPTGQVAQTFGMDAYRAAFAYRRACVAVAEAVQLALYAILALWISWRLVPVALAAGAGLVLLLRRVVAMSREAGDEQTSAGIAAAARLTDAVQAFKPFKAMARQGALMTAVESDVNRLANAERRQVVATESVPLILEPALAAILGLGLYLAVAPGAQPLASVIVLAVVFYRMAGRLQRLQSEYQQMAVNESAYWSLEEWAQRAEFMAERTGGAAPPATGVDVTLSDVAFRYADGPTILRNVNLRVPAGALVVVVGPSGSGKTTLLDLVAGLRAPDSGAILVNGVPLDRLELASWRRRIGYVPQETVLLHDTVARNIAMGDAVSPEDVERALRAAAAWDFVARMPGGLDAVVGERGMKLSGGQRRRLALARALVRDPVLLILDEPTSDVDADTAVAIEQTLNALRGRSSILVASHDMRLARSADAVYEIRDGRVHELSATAAAT